MEERKQDQTYQIKHNNYNCTITLTKEYLFIQLICDKTLRKYNAKLDNQFIKNNKNFEFFFETTLDLYHFITTCFEKVTITKEGTLMFNLEMNLGPKTKEYLCEIPTIKAELGEQQMNLLKTNQMQTEIGFLKEQNQKFKKMLEQQLEDQIMIKNKILEFERIINSKDQIINIIFHELKQIRQWKQEKQKQVSDKTIKFVEDQTNPHSKKFVQIGNRFKKIAGGSWEVLINKIKIDKNQITKVHIKQIRAGTNGSFMYGIGSSLIKGLNRAQDSKEFIGYYENTGNVYELGQSKKGGPKIKDGEIVTMIIDPKKWRLFWNINGKLVAQASIRPEIRMKDLYIALIVFNDESEIQFLN